LHTLGLICDGLLFGPLRVRDAATEVEEILFRNVDAEGADCEIGHAALLSVDRAPLVTIAEVQHIPLRGPAHPANE
jgi:hypothetical protein